MTNERLLLNAVVEQAAKDYIEALCKHHDAVGSKDIERHQWTITELEEFFTGEGIKSFTTLDGNYLMRKLKELVIEYKYDLKEINHARAACSEEA